MHVLRTFTEPTDVYISGDYFQDPKVKSAFGITDDESGCDITNGIDTVGINTYGFVYILTADEFRDAIPSIEYLKDADDYDLKHWNWDGIYLKDFVGDIKLKLESREDNTDRDIKKGECVLSHNFDPEDYAWGQYTDKAELIEVSKAGYETRGCIVDTELITVLPIGTRMSKRMDTLQLIKLLEENDKLKKG